jgi:mRNA interferase HigB
MRVIKPATVRQWMKRHPTAKPSLEGWLGLVRAASWRSLVELKRTFPHADQVTTATKRLVIVFNIAGNNYRLIAAIHFNTGVVFALSFLTHAEYSKDNWKDQL